MRVLIVRLGAFGDIVHSLPLAADLAAAGLEVHWLCEDRWAVLLEGSPALHGLHRLPRRAWECQRTPLRERLVYWRNLARRLRQINFEAVIDAQGLAKSQLWALASKGLRIGFARGRARELSWLGGGRRRRPLATHVIDQQRELGVLLLRLLRRPHPGGAWHFPLPAWQSERAGMSTWLRHQGLTQPWLLNVGAGWPTKVWPAERQIAFARLLRERRLPLVLAWGSPAERSLAQHIVQEVPGTHCAPPTSIPELGALLAQAAVVISGDTGPLHLARALGTPALGLFGPVPAERNGVRGPHWHNLQAPGAAWERRNLSRVDMAALLPEAVLAAAQALGR